MSIDLYYDAYYNGCMVIIHKDITMFDISKISITDNYTSITDFDSKSELIVESFDNVEFDISIMPKGNDTGDYRRLGCISAQSNSSLIAQLSILLNGK